MKNKKVLVLLCLLFVLILAGASVLYTRLSQEIEPEQMVVQDTEVTEESAESTDTEEPEQSAESTDTEEPTESTTTEESTEAEPKLLLAPDFIAYDEQGNEVRLYDYIGKPIVLNFWASWCGPCIIEMPGFHEKYLELGEEVQFLMINRTDGSRETVESASAFIKEKGYTFPVFYDTEAYGAQTYGTYSIPTTFFINAEGYLVAWVSRAIDSETLQIGIDMIYNS